MGLGGIVGGLLENNESGEGMGMGVEGLCIGGCVGEEGKVGMGEGNVGGMLVGEESKWFGLLGGEECLGGGEGGFGGG